jgi:hypothetical protein
MMIRDRTSQKIDGEKFFEKSMIFEAKRADLARFLRGGGGGE